MNRVQISIINQALDNPDKLTTWEVDFINDIAMQDEDYEISKKQNAVLNRISGKLV